jgi:KDEL-tailed cysteine endopeptidase
LGLVKKAATSKMVNLFAFAVACATPLLVNADLCSPFSFISDSPGFVGFQKFVLTFKPVFTQTNLSASERLDLLRNTVSFVNDHNSQSSSSAANYTLGINELSAYSQLELKQRNGFRHVASKFPDFSSVTPGRFLASLPASIDWVAAGAVTAVTNQKQCGCCWAIATAGAVEGAAAIQSNMTYLQSLSFQQLISCDTSGDGCNGGNTVTALDYTMNNELGGLTTDSEYPFVDGDGATTTTCKSKDYALAVGASKPTTVTDTYTGDTFSTRVFKMKQALAYGGPVVIVINAECADFQSYSSGVLTSSSCACSDETCLNHAVLLVGYNDTNNPAYWKIKNSWGECWGESGYVRVSQEQEGEFGKLGLLAQGVLPLSAYNYTAQKSSARSAFHHQSQLVAASIFAGVLASVMI